MTVSDSPQLRPVRVLLMADTRSPTTWGWVDAVRSAGVVVLGADGEPWPERLTANGSGQLSRTEVRRWLRPLLVATPRILKLTQSFLRLAGPVLSILQGHRMRRVARRSRPDIIHGLRIPYEAMVARVACPPGVPLAVSIWGNDLTLHASASQLIGRSTRKVLVRADLLFADCERDVGLAAQWGLRPSAVTAIFPGGGGIDLAETTERDWTRVPQLDELAGSDWRLVLNARGTREYVRNDTLLEALSLLPRSLDPRVRFVFVDAAHDIALRRSIEGRGLADRIIVMGKRTPAEMLWLFSRSEVSVSITEHDGTPNSLLEAMAAGTIPVCGDLVSIREWIQHEKNGFLAPFDDPRAVGEALLLALALSDTERKRMQIENRRIVSARAERRSTGFQAAEIYRRMADKGIGRLADA